MSEKCLIIGGCRSGKSRYALECAGQSGAARKVFIATCQGRDPEMTERIQRHQEERGPEWATVEEPVHLPGIIERESAASTLLLVDCLTLWVSNLLMQDLGDDEIRDWFTSLDRALQGVSGRVLLVSNEVGQGLVPDNPMGRRFRDLTGWLNQRVAACVDRVVWMVAGLPVCIKE